MDELVTGEELAAIKALADAMPTGEVTLQEREIVHPLTGWRREYDLCVARYPFATFKTAEEARYHAAVNPAFIRRLLAHIAAQERIVRAAIEYRQVNTALDNEPPHPHPDPLAHSLLIRIGEQKRAALFAAVDGMGDSDAE